MPLESSEPTVINTVVVTAEDLASALEAKRTSGKQAVLRITPPFSGRMRARLHVVGAEPYEQKPEPIHIEPETLVDDIPPYPQPADTEDELRADPDREYSVDTHHEYHARVVEEWRKAVPAAVEEHASIETPAGSVTVDISILGNIE